MRRQDIVSGGWVTVHFARSETDTPLKVSSMVGVITGVLLLSSIAYAVLTLNLRPVDYSSPFTVSSVSFVGMIDAPFVILGGLLGLFGRMSIETRGVLAFFVFIASIFAIIGSLGLLSVPGP
jgi:hypothetical protein